MGLLLSNLTAKSVNLISDTAPIDPDYGSVQLLLHMDGTENSTTFTDNSQNNFSISTADGGVITTSTSKFGGASGKFTDVGRNARVITPTSAALKIVGDFTTELWYNASVVQAGSYFFGCLNTSHVWFTLNGSSQLEYYCLGNQISSGVVPVAGTWYHLAISRTSGQVRFFLNGVQFGSTQANSNDMGNNAYWTVGSAPQLAGSGTGSRCYIDDVRITIGAGRYTTNFTPPTAAFPNS